MGLNIFDLLLPREIKFFKYMNRQTAIFSDACIALKKLVSQIEDMNEDDIHRHVAKVKEFELRGDQIEMFIINELNKTFITPLDREDIHDIVANIDNSLDKLNSVAQKIEMYKIRKVPQNVVKFMTIIVDVSLELRALIRNLKDKKDMNIIIRKIHVLENEADNLFHTTMAELFSNKKDPVSIIKFKQIYEHLEEIVNSVDTIGKLVRGIMVKQG